MDGAASEALLAHGVGGIRIAAPFPIWLIDVKGPPHRSILQVLSPDEHDRAGRFTRDSLRHRYQAAHGALRMIVECATGIAARRQTYLPDGHGKPILQEAAHVDCSISYSGPFALVAWASGARIGVDLEVERTIGDSPELAAMYYTEDEVADLARRTAGKPDHAFLTVWVRKEACSKALGKGLSIPPASFECGVGCGERDVFIENEIVRSSVLNPKDGLLASWAYKGHLEA